MEKYGGESISQLQWNKYYYCIILIIKNVKIIHTQKQTTKIKNQKTECSDK